MTRMWMPAVIACLLASAALADPSILSGGILVTHYDPQYFSYTYDPPAGGWCELYNAHPIQNLGDLNPELMSAGACVWFVLAAWESEPKVWCGTEFGFGAYDASLFDVYDYGPCFPGTGIEIPTPGWPGPNEGTAFVTTGDPWIGNWLPVYWFGGYAYDYTYGSTVIPIAVDPPTGFCGFANCQSPPAVFSVRPPLRGGMGINMPGYAPVFPPPVFAACCLAQPLGACAMLTEEECGLAAGTWLGEGTACEPVNPCPQPGACCTAGYCHVMLEETCALLDGTFQGAGTICEPNPCPAVCCYCALGHPPCEILLEADCLAIPGFWHPEWTTCDPNPCDVYPSPAQSTTWGRIKSMYR